MRRELILGLLVTVMLLGTVRVAMAGFDQYGYNYQARIFVGTGMQWCEQRGITTTSACEAVLGGPYTNDKLVMKWSKAWDAARFGPDGIRNSGDELPWSPDAWEDNEWNGMVPGGSGISEHYKIIWVGPLLEGSPYWRPGGYAVWSEFEVIMDQGTGPTGHFWAAHASPTGYGVQP